MGIVQDTKEVVGLVRKLDNQDLYARILDLQGQILELREENLRLKTEALASRDIEDIQHKISRKDGENYYEVEGRTGKFCLACWDYSNKLIGLIEIKTSYGFTIQCGICDKREKS